MYITHCITKSKKGKSYDYTNICKNTFEEITTHLFRNINVLDKDNHGNIGSK